MHGDVSSLRKYKIVLSMLKEYKSRPGDAGFFKIFKTHRKGFTVNDWDLLGLTDESCKNYLSSKQYYNMHPLNGAFSWWIDDKLTLWYLCQCAELSEYMPIYYYHLDNKRIMPIGDGRRLFDASLSSIDNVANLLEDIGTLAVKMVKGSMGCGFYKAEYKDSSYCLNGERLTRDEWCRRVSQLDGYIICEYLRPHEDFARVYPNTPNTLRYLACRVDGKLQFLKGYVRFGSTKSGFVENFNAGGVLCFIDSEGRYSSGRVIDRSDGLAARVIERHPETGVQLCGTVPLWEKVQDAVEAFDEYFPQLDYVGFDFVITDDGRAIILETNSLTSLDGFQLDCSTFDTPIGKAFFGPRLAELRNNKR